MKAFQLLICLAFLNVVHAQPSILDIANKAIDKNFVISYYNKPTSATGVLLFEESHNRQAKIAHILENVYSIDSQFNKIALEGLYYDSFKAPRLTFDSTTQREKLVYDLVIEKYLRIKPDSATISNAEYLYLKYPVKLLKTENESDYKIPLSDRFPSDEIVGKLYTYDKDLYDRLITTSLTSEEYRREFLVDLKASCEKLDIDSSSINNEITFSNLVTRRTDTIAKYTKNYYLQYQKIFAIIGGSHTSRMVAHLLTENVPFVVISDKESIYSDEDTGSIKKPEPKINQPHFQQQFELTLLYYLYADFVQSARNSLPNSFKKIIDQFNHVKNVRSISPKIISFTLNGITHTLKPDLFFIRTLQRDINNSNLSQAIIQSTTLKLPSREFKDLSISNISWQVQEVLTTYVNSNEYQTQKDKLKYKAHPDKKNMAATETDFTDNYLFQELRDKLSNQLIIQNAISMGKRPDWSLNCIDGNYVAEVKYIRNRGSFNYAFELLHSDQIEKYVTDEYLKPKHFDLIILFDKANLDKLKIPGSKLTFLKACLELQMQNLRLQYQHINFNLIFIPVFVPKKPINIFNPIYKGNNNQA